MAPTPSRTCRGVAPRPGRGPEQGGRQLGIGKGFFRRGAWSGSQFGTAHGLARRARHQLLLLGTSTVTRTRSTSVHSTPLDLRKKKTRFNPQQKRNLYRNECGGGGIQSPTMSGPYILSPLNRDRPFWGFPGLGLMHGEWLREVQYTTKPNCFTHTQNKFVFH